MTIFDKIFVNRKVYPPMRTGKRKGVHIAAAENCGTVRVFKDLEVFPEGGHSVLCLVCKTEEKFYLIRM